MQGDRRGGPPRKGQEEEDRVAGAANPRRDSLDDLLGDSQDEEEIQARDKEEGGVGPQAINGDGQRDASSKEARKEEGPEKEK